MDSVVFEGEYPNDDSDRREEIGKCVWDEKASRAVSVAVDVFPVRDVCCGVVSKRPSALGTEVRRSSYVRRSLCIKRTVMLELSSSIRTSNVRFLARSMSCRLCANNLS
jgi:hypothetical protein